MKKPGLGTRYTDLNLPAETRQYVPKLQAVKNIIADPDSFDTELPVIENHPFFQVVDIDRDMDAQVVAELADVSLDDFKALNPSLKKPVIFAAATPQILLPWDNAKVFEQNLRELKTGTSNVDKLASWTVWTVPKTMSVADVAQQVGMAEAQLREANNIPPRMMIKAGSALMVTRSDNLNQDVALHIADNGQPGISPPSTASRPSGKGKAVRVQRRRYPAQPGAQVPDRAWRSWPAGTDLAPNAQLRAGQNAAPAKRPAARTTQIQGQPARPASAPRWPKTPRKNGAAPPPKRKR